MGVLAAQGVVECVAVALLFDAAAAPARRLDNLGLKVNNAAAQSSKQSITLARASQAIDCNGNPTEPRHTKPRLHLEETCFLHVHWPNTAFVWA